MRQKIIDIATSQIGTKENPPGSNQVKYNDWFYNKKGASGAWCGTSVSWVFNEAGVPLGKIDFLRGYASCQYAVTNVKKWGRIVTKPEPADIVFFDWNGDGHFDHTGIFVKDSGGGFFQSLEGNTGFGNDSNGGEYMNRERRYKNAIFVRPYALEKSL
jgi:cell wall-associated NlpC family hydrolase